MSSNDEAVRGYPTDLIGNEIKKNSMIVVNFPSSQVIMRVADVHPVSLTDGIQIEGSLTCVVQLPHTGQIPIALVVKEPNESSLITPSMKMPDDVLKM